MAKNALLIEKRESHRREYRRTMRRIVAGSVVLWFVLAVALSNNDSASAIVPMSVVLLVALAATRITVGKQAINTSCPVPLSTG